MASRNTPTNIRYQLVTPTSLLSNRLMEMMSAHKQGVEYIHDNFPVYKIAQAIVDKNTVIISQVSEQGYYNIEE